MTTKPKTPKAAAAALVDEADRRMSMSKIEEARRRITDAVYLTCLTEIVSQEIEMGNILDGLQTSRCAGAICGAARIAGEKLNEASELLDLAEMAERKNAPHEPSRGHPSPAVRSGSRSHGRSPEDGNAKQKAPDPVSWPNQGQGQAWR